MRPESKNEGWIKLYRKSLHNGWLRNHKRWAFWSYCMLKASHREHKVMIGNQQIILQPGQFVFGRKRAAQELDLSERQIRTCIDSLKTMGNVTIKTTNKFSLITIVNWELYQDIETKTTSKTTSKRPATCHIQEGKNVRKEKRNSKESPSYQKIKTKDISDYFISKVFSVKGMKYSFAGKKDGIILKRFAENPEVDYKELIDFFLTTKKSEEHLSLSACFSTDTINQFKLKKAQDPQKVIQRDMTKIYKEAMNVGD